MSALYAYHAENRVLIIIPLALEIVRKMIKMTQEAEVE